MHECDTCKATLRIQGGQDECVYTHACGIGGYGVFRPIDPAARLAAERERFEVWWEYDSRVNTDYDSAPAGWLAALWIEQETAQLPRPRWRCHHCKAEVAHEAACDSRLGGRCPACGVLALGMIEP